MIHPRCFVLPSGWKLQGVVAFSDRIRLLKMPHILEEERLLFYFVFVADNVSRLWRRDMEDLEFYVRHQLAPVRVGGHFRCILVFDFVVLPLRGNTPPVQRLYFSLRIKVNIDRAMFAAFGPQDFVGFSNLSSYLVRGYNGNVSLGIQQDGVGFFVVGRQWSVDQGVHPGGSVAAGESIRSEA